ncbi:hypothetical protein DAI22_11g220700 [Oryza sativa Japonica Group]|nr:hypothetical protein DAI22_11g220700 [Oryza sativa Japonica Group]
MLPLWHRCQPLNLLARQLATTFRRRLPECLVTHLACCEGRASCRQTERPPLASRSLKRPGEGMSFWALFFLQQAIHLVFIPLHITRS